MLKKNPKEKQ